MPVPHQVGDDGSPLNKGSATGIKYPPGCRLQFIPNPLRDRNDNIGVFINGRRNIFEKAEADIPGQICHPLHNSTDNHRVNRPRSI